MRLKARSYAAIPRSPNQWVRRVRRHPVRSALLSLFVVAFTATSTVAEPPSSKFVGLASDNRKLADVGADSELWVITVTRVPELRGSGFPERVSVVYLTGRAKPYAWHAAFPDGTEFVLQLARGTDGSYQTVYYRDETHPPKLY